MAPELFSSEGVHSYSTDFWAIGCLMFELRMNSTPFSCRSSRDQNNDQTVVGYEEEVDGTPQEILENIRKYPLSVIVEMMIERSQQRIERNKSIQRTKSPNKHNNAKAGDSSRDSYVPTISPELMDLLCWMLERAPPYRCSW
jgi:serine/threonine protein kinase